jgi:hypothetical protein
VLGDSVGARLGELVGELVGILVAIVGDAVGNAVGDVVGDAVSDVGEIVGALFGVLGGETKLGLDLVEKSTSPQRFTVNVPKVRLPGARTLNGRPFSTMPVCAVV